MLIPFVNTHTLQYSGKYGFILKFCPDLIFAKIQLVLFRPQYVRQTNCQCYWLMLNNSWNNTTTQCISTTHVDQRQTLKPDSCHDANFVVVRTTCGAVSDEKDGIMKIEIVMMPTLSSLGQPAVQSVWKKISWKLIWLWCQPCFYCWHNRHHFKV